VRLGAASVGADVSPGIDEGPLVERRPAIARCVPDPSPTRGALVKLLVWSLALAALALAVVVVEAVSREEPEALAAKPLELPTVSFVRLPLGEHRMNLSVLSRLEPRYRSEIGSIVEGRVSSFGERFEVGADVARDEVLARIDSSAHEARRAEAARALAQARADASVERREAEQAEAEWRSLGRADAGDPSPLFLREPQEAAARLAVVAARKALDNAEELLAATTIRAPFDATVLARSIGPGEFVGAGQTVAELASNDEFVIAAELTGAQWKLLDLGRMDEPLTVTDLERDVSRNARLRSLGRLLDERTRLRTVYLTLEDEAPIPDMVAGQFVEVRLPGRSFEAVLTVPESAYTRDSAIWTIDGDDRLEKLPVRLLAIEEGTVILERPNGDSAYRVVIDPQSRFTVGMPVESVEREPLALGEPL